MQLALMATEPFLGGYGQAAAVAGAAAMVALLLLVAAAGARRTDLRTQAAAYPAFLLLSAGYWLPAMRCAITVYSTIWRCPSLAQLPAALLSPAVLPHLLLFLWGCEAWSVSQDLERAANELPAAWEAALDSVPPYGLSDWPFAACRHILYMWLPGVGGGTAARLMPCCTTAPAWQCFRSQQCHASVP